MSPEDILGHLGLAPSVAALVWAALGGAMLWQKLKNGKAGTGDDLVRVVEELRRTLEGLPKHINAAHREALETMAERIDLDARTREVERREHAKRA